MATTPKKTPGKTKDDVQTPEPIVYERTDSRDDREYSDGTKDAQRFFEGVVDSTDRLSRAVADGVSEYRERHYASAEEKEDGAVRDLLENVGEGLSKALDTASDAPRDFTRKVSLKRLTRLVTPIPFNVFLRR